MGVQVKRGIKSAPKFSLAKITGELIGKPWGEVGCIEVLHRVYNEYLGIEAPVRYRHLNLDNWRAHFEKNPDKTARHMLNFLKRRGRPADLDRLTWWDLVVCRQPDGGLFPGVYVGRGRVLTSTITEGVILAPLDDTNRPLFARRFL